jgi:hypothetical protein
MVNYFLNKVLTVLKSVASLPQHDKIREPQVVSFTNV